MIRHTLYIANGIYGQITPDSQNREGTFVLKCKPTIYLMHCRHLVVTFHVNKYRENLLISVESIYGLESESISFFTLESESIYPLGEPVMGP